MPQWSASIPPGVAFPSKGVQHAGLGGSEISWKIATRIGWEHVFNAIEKAGKTRIASVEDFLNLVDSGDTKIKRSLKDQFQMYMCQLKAYLRTYTGGELHARVSQTRSDGIMDLLRDIVYKGKNRNPNRLIVLKAKALSPAKSSQNSCRQNIGREVGR